MSTNSTGPIGPITSLADLATHIGCDPARILRLLFKDTDCGVVFNHDEKGVTVCGYAEGADAECMDHRLDYPFHEAEFWKAVEEADAEGGALWEEWNE